MSEPVPCTCGGSNENCSHCFGAGFLSRPSQSATGKAANRPYRASNTQQHQLQVSMQKPRLHVPPLPVRKGNSSVQRKQVSSSKGQGRGTSNAVDGKTRSKQRKISSLKRPVYSGQPELVFRDGEWHPISPELSDRERVELELKNMMISAGLAKPNETPSSSIPKTNYRKPQGQKIRIPSVGIKTGFAICPLCKVQMKESRIDSHLDRRCPKRGGISMGQIGVRVGLNVRSSPGSARTGSGARGRGPAQPVSGSKRRKAPTFRPAEESPLSQTIDRMDATRGMGFVVRESGRYGSHPIYDSCDDESGPDG